MRDMVLYVLASGLTVVAYAFALFAYRRCKSPFLNPILLAVLIIAAVIQFSPLNWDDYVAGSLPIVKLLPLTIIILALPLFRKRLLLRQYYKAVLAGVFAGVVSSALSLFILGRLFGIDEVVLRSIFPKSITTPLGVLLCEMLSGLVGVAVISIVITGILGVILYVPVFKLFRIKHPVARGIALGTASHAIGTSKAIELGDEEGGMSSLALVVSGILTTVLTPLFLLLISMY